jgi:hypothetical protein
VRVHSNVEARHLFAQTEAAAVDQADDGNRDEPSTGGRLAHSASALPVNPFHQAAHQIAVRADFANPRRAAPNRIRRPAAKFHTPAK